MLQAINLKLYIIKTFSKESEGISVIEYRDGIFKLLRSPGIDSKESIPLANVAPSLKLKSRYGARNRFQNPSLELSSQAT